MLLTDGRLEIRGREVLGALIYVFALPSEKARSPERSSIVSCEGRRLRKLSSDVLAEWSRRRAAGEVGVLRLAWESASVPSSSSSPLSSSSSSVWDIGWKEAFDRDIVGEGEGIEKLRRRGLTGFMLADA